MTDKEVQPSKTSNSDPDTPEIEQTDDGRELTERERKFVEAFESKVEAQDQLPLDEPEKPAKAKPEKAEAPEPKEAKPEKPKPDLSQAPEEVQSHIKELENRLKAHQGQLAPTQRVAQERLNENKRLKAELEELRKKAAAQAQKLEKWEKHKDDFPDETAAYEELVQARVAEATTTLKQEVESLKARLDSQTQEIDGRLGGVEQNTAKQNLQAELAAITEAHADWKDHLEEGGERAPAFYRWVENQPLDVQRMFYRNLKENVAANDVNWLLSSFKRDQQKESDAPTPPPKPNGNGVQAARQERVQRAASPPGGDTPSVSPPQHRKPMTREEEFALAWEAKHRTG